MIGIKQYEVSKMICKKCLKKKADPESGLCKDCFKLKNSKKKVIDDDEEIEFDDDDEDISFSKDDEE